MNSDRLQGMWKQVRAMVREQRGRMLSDYVEVTDARREQIAGMVQERCGIAKEQADRELAEWRRQRRHQLLS
jgi:uncharacterized protein YjbJ (UPF0337 family)